MTGNRLGALHHVADLARASRPATSTLAELQEHIGAPPAIGEILNEVLAEAPRPADRPARVPNSGHRSQS